MATVTVLTAERMLEIEASSVTSGDINAEGHLILMQEDGTPIDVGAVSGMRIYTGSAYEAAGDSFSYIGPADPGAVADGSVWYDTDDIAGPFASDTQQGLVELATNAETTTGTDTTRAVTPAGVKAVADTKQPTDADLTAFAALAPANDDVVQRKAGAWTNRTMAQLLVDLLALPLAGGTVTGTITSSQTASTVALLAGLVNADTFNRIHILASGAIEIGSGAAAREIILSRTAAGVLTLTGADLRITTAGKGLRIAEGSNAKMGIATLNGSTAVVVNTTAVTAASRIFMTTNNINASPAFGAPYVFARTAGTSFSIKSSSGTDVSTVAWMIVEPG